jgi:hypothetical protein
MAATTPTYGFPYPVGSDPLADGDNQARALAERVEAVLVGLIGGGVLLSDLNATPVPGFWYTGGGVTNGPPGGYVYLCGLTAVRGDPSGGAGLIAMDVLSTKTWRRSYISGAWGAWKEITVAATAELRPGEDDPDQDDPDDPG